MVTSPLPSFVAVIAALDLTSASTIESFAIIAETTLEEPIAVTPELLTVMSPDNATLVNSVPLEINKLAAVVDTAASAISSISANPTLPPSSIFS